MVDSKGRMKKIGYMIWSLSLLLFQGVCASIECTPVSRVDKDFAKGVDSLPNDLVRLLGTFVGISYYKNPHCVRMCNGHVCSIRSIEFDPSYSKAITRANFDPVVCVWDANNGALLKNLSMYNVTSFCSWLAAARIYVSRKKFVDPYHVRAACFADKGGQVATGLRNGTVCFWQASSGDFVKKMNCHKHCVTSLQFCLSDEVMVTASEDGSSCVWYMPSGSCLFCVDGHSQGCLRAHLLPASDILVTEDMFGKYNAWKLVVKKGLFKRLPIEFGRHTKKIEYSKDKDEIVAWDGRTVKKWDCAAARLSDKLFDTLAQSLPGNADKDLLHCRNQRAVSIWDRQSHKIVYKFYANRRGILYSDNDDSGVPFFVTETDRECSIYKSGENCSKLLLGLRSAAI